MAIGGLEPMMADEMSIEKPFRMVELAAAVRSALTRIVMRGAKVIPLRPPSAG